MKGAVFTILLQIIIGVFGELQLGSTVNIFTRYGFLAWSMRVLPDTTTGSAFTEPTKTIYNHRIQAKDIIDNVSITMDMSFCETVEQLYQTYFKNYHIEGFTGGGVWRGFVGQWENNRMLSATKLGINETYLDQNVSFVFVRITRTTQRHSIPDGFNFKTDLNGNVVAFLNDIKNTSDVMEFIRTYGTHYIHSYVLGDSVFQVFVFRKRKFTLLRNIYKTKKNVEHRRYFSPWYAEHIGLIRKASGGLKVEDWMNKKIVQPFYIMRFPSIFELSKKLNVESFKKDRRRANYVQNMVFTEDILIQLDLRTLDTVMSDVAMGVSFREELNNRIKLWEMNK